jgi:hypothetical protein
MLTTFDRSAWREDAEEERERSTLHLQSPEEMVRKHFPYKVILTHACKIYGFKEGDVLPYARTRHELQYYPIQAITYGIHASSTRLLYLASDEAILMEVSPHD